MSLAAQSYRSGTNNALLPKNNLQRLKLLTVIFSRFGMSGMSMRTFFYSIQKTDCCSDCHWQVCPQRYLARLKAISELRNIQPIFGEISFVSPPSDTIPRNGDIVILFAKDSHELDMIIAAGEGFDGLRKILVMADSKGIKGEKYHKLAPRFITQAERHIGELEAVILRMKGHIH